MMTVFACFTAISSNAQTLIDGIYYNLNSTDNTAEVTRKGSGSKATKYKGEVTIPSTIESEGKTYTVTSIAANAFNANKSLTKITIPSTIKKMGNAVFYNCTQLSTGGVHISDLNAWLAIEFNGGSTKNGQNSNPLNYGKKLYLNNTEVTELVIPDGITTINNYAFCGCTSITSLTLPEGLKTIGVDAFKGCSNITKLSIPSSVTAIGDNAFNGCTSVTGVYITDIAAWCNIDFGGSTVGLFSKSGNKNLYLNGELVTDLVIPEGVTSINKYAFFGCESLKSVTFPSTLTSINGDSFRGCTNLTSVTFPSSLTDIGSQSFMGCSSLATITFNGTTPPTIGDNAFNGCATNINVTVPEGSKDAYNTALSGKIGKSNPTITNIATAITEQTQQDDAIYNLQGQRVTTMQRGHIYIKGGKKILY